ncbi:MAG TPA: hypothetical protein VFC78_24380 [Tepidisphaeraceae bacterium]|nr:hypothetical protein [Tepidisphaeraceae bacterium]
MATYKEVEAEAKAQFEALAADTGHNARQNDAGDWQRRREQEYAPTVTEAEVSRLWREQNAPPPEPEDHASLNKLRQFHGLPKK